MIKIVASSILLFTITIASAQKGDAPENWYNLDPKEDKVYGTGADKALEILKENGIKPTKVIVAVIDSGTEVDHDDLKNVIWVNEDEISGNGIDDDQNGYVDDIHGWSFLGGETEDINHEALELTRIYQDLAPKYKGKKAEDVENTEEYEYWLEIEKSFNEDLTKNVNVLNTYMFLYSFVEKVEKKSEGKFTKETLDAYEPEDDTEKSVKESLLGFIETLGGGEELKEELEHGLERLEPTIENAMLNSDSIRQVVVGDNPEDPTEKFYGCNRYEGPDAFHGTHVAGIIAADRNNAVGIMGHSPDVEIMVVRAVPNGDERDKDVANAIYYAVDNGASIINMSFGKYYSPNKKVVDDAMAYAASKDVLLIHAAGNDSKDNDVEDSYPTNVLDNGTTLDNWIEVGATSWKKGKDLTASFSNYGKNTVDLWAPGVAIHSTVPDNGYKNAQGTSMACPSVAGVAAIIRSYFPEMSAAEVKTTLMETVEPYKKKVYLPGGEIVETKKGSEVKEVKTRLSDISVSGGIVNAKNAVNYLLELD